MEQKKTLRLEHCLIYEGQECRKTAHEDRSSLKSVCDWLTELYSLGCFQ
jgi:hypothetical protein